MPYGEDFKEVEHKEEMLKKLLKAKFDFSVLCSDVGAIQQIETLSKLPTIEYTATIKPQFGNALKISVEIPDKINRCATAIDLEDYEHIYGYTILNGDQFAAYGLCVRFDIDTDSVDWREDEKGERTKFEELEKYIEADSLLLVGTILDFMNPEKMNFDELMRFLEKLEDLNITLISASESDYDIRIYRQVLPLATALYRMKLGKKPYGVD